MILKEHRPNYFTGYEDKEYEFNSLKEFLDIPWVKTKKIDGVEGFRYVFSQPWEKSTLIVSNSDKTFPNTRLMVEYWCPKEKKDYYWVVGLIWCTEEEYDRLGLPVWINPLEHPEVTRRGKGEQIFNTSRKTTATITQRLKKFFKLG